MMKKMLKMFFTITSIDVILFTMLIISPFDNIYIGNLIIKVSIIAFIILELYTLFRIKIIK